MTTDQDWARDLFERSREGEEPVWIADHAAMMRSGRRRNRVRALTASGSVVVTAAVVAAVGIGVGGGVSHKTPDPGPGQGAPPTKKTEAAVADPSKVLDYVSFDSFSTKDGKGGSGFFAKYYIPVAPATARDSMELLSKLDPTLAHFAKTSPSGDRVRMVPGHDAMAQDMAQLSGDVLWTDDGMSAAAVQARQATAPTGILNLTYMDSSKAGQAGDCTSYGILPTNMLDPTGTPGGGWTDAAKWTPCVTKNLPDGSTLMSSTKSYGPFLLATAVRKLPGDGGAVVLSWQNFPAFVPSPTGPPNIEAAPDPKRALSPNPITVDKLLAAASDTALVPPLAPLSSTPPPTTALQTSDFGAGWSIGADGVVGQTGDLVVDNGCSTTQNPVAASRPVYFYAGKTPSGTAVQASESVDAMSAGSGPDWMAELRKHETGGCDLPLRPDSHDTTSPLPAGLGDDAFVEYRSGQANATAYIRFGDDILEVEVITTGANKPAFTQADKEWFQGLAAKAAARYRAKG